MERHLLDSATALVTGAGSGIGAATARRLAERGCRVICAGRTLAPLQTLVDELATDALALELDVSDPVSVSSLLDRLPVTWRTVDLLINSAGHDEGGRRHFVEGEAEQWTAIIETNVNGVIRVTRALLEGMLERDRGHVVNIGSIAGVRPYEGGGAYVASKFAVRGLSECLRLDCRESRVRISEILPGTVRTEFAERRTGDADAANSFYDGFPELLEADDVARAIVYALEQPPHVVVSQLFVLPSCQG